MAEVYIGTSGYDYPEWKGLFYGENVKRKDYLTYYASQFNSLELNGTYYRMPDEKQMSRMKTEYIATSGIAYMRFHGRNGENWYTGNNVTRYDYFYTDTELESFVDPIKELLKRTKIVQLFFNNHAKAQATINAKKLEMLLKAKNS